MSKEMQNNIKLDYNNFDDQKLWVADGEIAEILHLDGRNCLEFEDPVF